MRSMEITDEWLYQHMPVVDNAMITALENQVDREYVFSKRFEQKMQKVIRREAHPVLTGAQQLLKRMAIFFTGIVCAGLVLTLSVDAYRDKFFMTLKTCARMLRSITTLPRKKMRYSLPRYRPASRRAIQRQTEETVLFFVKFSMKTMPENSSSGSKC